MQIIAGVFVYRLIGLATKEDVFQTDDGFKRQHYMTPADEAVQYGQVYVIIMYHCHRRHGNTQFAQNRLLNHAILQPVSCILFKKFQIPKIRVQRPTPTESGKRLKAQSRFDLLTFVKLQYVNFLLLWHWLNIWLNIG